MATRYSGSVKVTLLWKDRENQYRCVVKVPGERAKVIWVGAPAHLTVGVDSPKAYDSTARAALSFADDEGLPVSNHADTDAMGQGWAISRKKGGAAVGLSGLRKKKRKAKGKRRSSHRRPSRRSGLLGGILGG